MNKFKFGSKQLKIRIKILGVLFYSGTLKKDKWLDLKEKKGVIQT